MKSIVKMKVTPFSLQSHTDLSSVERANVSSTGPYYHLCRMVQCPLEIIGWGERLVAA